MGTYRRNPLGASLFKLSDVFRLFDDAKASRLADSPNRRLRVAKIFGQHAVITRYVEYRVSESVFLSIGISVFEPPALIIALVYLETAVLRRTGKRRIRKKC